MLTRKQLLGAGAAAGSAALVSACGGDSQPRGSARAELEDDGYGVAVYHSHPRSAAEPSQTDINLAFYPNWLYVIVSPEVEPNVRAWRIADGRVSEEAIEVED